MSTESKVRFERDGALGTVTLDSPPLNLIGQELIADLLEANLRFRAHRRGRLWFVVVLRY